jgi:endoglucanase
LLLQLAETQPEYDITISFTVQEEIGLRGATTVANACQPDIVVIVDGTTAADGMGVSGYKQVCCSGGGPVVSFMDRSTLYDKDLYAFVRGLADDNGIPTQTKSMISGGNDAGAFQRAGIGAYVTAVSLPCRYIHSPSSVVRDEDAKNTYRLLKLLSEKLPLWETPV